MSRPPTTARQKIDRLAEDIATAASQQGIELSEKVEALKALTGYLGAIQKGRRKSDDEPDTDGVDFESFRAAALGGVAPPAGVAPPGGVPEEGDTDGSKDRSRAPKLHVGRRERVRDLRSASNSISDPN